MATPFYILEPEVAGGLGRETVVDTSAHPPLVHHLHYQFEGWLGDEILESFPCYIVALHIAEALRRSSLTGFELRPTKITRTVEFEERQPSLVLPQFEWLQVTGHPGEDDFGLAKDHRMVVSDRALNFLNGFRTQHCAIKAWAA